jgi:hypothetical protein
MNILDENVLASQRAQLLKWRIAFRQIGFEIGKSGMEDEQIIPLLLRLQRPTFFTQDRDFDKPSLCHPRYAMVFIETKRTECAAYIRRFLKHGAFDSQTKRMGKVVRVSPAGIAMWQRNRTSLEHLAWEK